MSTPAAFISYSREDSEFALRLAQDLKAAGASVWLDQLDLKPGSSWDNSIEDALLAAPQMLVVLSPISVKSENVRDEISYALRLGKTVIPVLYMDCVIPLRLERKQHIDFRSDYARGLAALLNQLHVEHPNQAVLDQAAEDDAKRLVVAQAREAEAQRIRELAAHEKREGAERQKKEAETREAEIQHHWNRDIRHQPVMASAPRRRIIFAIVGGVVLLLILLFACVFGFNVMRHHREESNREPNSSAAPANKQDQTAPSQPPTTPQATPQATKQNPPQTPPISATSKNQTPAVTQTQQAAFLSALANACMEMGDKDHPAARIIACKVPTSCKKMPRVGLYPVLQDGRIIDSAETLAIFLKACRDPAQPMAAMTDDAHTVEVP